MKINETTPDRSVTNAQFVRLSNWSKRKPVIALMGEFSSGKSTLMNLLIGQNILPTQVTATRMPPVWISYGEGAPRRMDRDGRFYDVDLSNTADIPIETTRYIRLFVKAPILQNCDLMDTPGISDPNIKTEYWLDTIRYASAVMWCSHAGQAWRESERGAWESLPMRLRETSILLVTRKDKLKSDRDLQKIERRLERETDHLFHARMFVSLTQAIKARENGDSAAWASSGAQEFSDGLDNVVEEIAAKRRAMLQRYRVQETAAMQDSEPAAPVSRVDNLLGFEQARAARAQQRQSPAERAASNLDAMFASMGVQLGDEPEQPDENAQSAAVTPTVLHPTSDNATPAMEAAQVTGSDEGEEQADAAPAAPKTYGLSDYRKAGAASDDTVEKSDGFAENQAAEPVTPRAEPSPEPADQEEDSLDREIRLIEGIFSQAQVDYDLTQVPHYNGAMKKLLSELRRKQRAAQIAKRFA